jgi:hypothetical protein
MGVRISGLLTKPLLPYDATRRGATSAAAGDHDVVG